MTVPIWFVTKHGNRIVAVKPDRQVHWQDGMGVVRRTQDASGAVMHDVYVQAHSKAIARVLAAARFREVER